jgi:hypothetical protein
MCLACIRFGSEAYAAPPQCANIASRASRMILAQTDCSCTDGNSLLPFVMRDLRFGGAIEPASTSQPSVRTQCGHESPVRARKP